MYQSAVKKFAAHALITAVLFGNAATVSFAQKIELLDSFDPGSSTIDEITTPCRDIKIPTTGNSGTSGSSGNIRAYAQGGVQLKASAFSKELSSWQTAFLGAFGSGLGVTNSSEDGTGSSHRVDNVGTRRDYVLFEFDQDVVIDQIYLDSVDTDSDITVWIGSGTNPYINHLTLSDALLTNFGPSETNSGGSSARWANINSRVRLGTFSLLRPPWVEPTMHSK